MSSLFDQISQCRVCETHLPLGPRPVVRADNSAARVLIIGQAPGTKVHASGLPWDDASGCRLRDWMGVTVDDFYDQSKFAIMPMGFCYPGRVVAHKGRGGDSPPRPECAPLWHERVRALLPNIKLTLLIGSYAQAYYLKATRKKSLTETVAAFRDYLPDGFFPLVHPSPRNQKWLRDNPWFDSEVVAELRARIEAMHVHTF